MPKSVLLSSLMPSSVMRISTDIRVGKILGIQVHPRIGRRFGGVGIASFLKTGSGRQAVGAVDDVLDRPDASLGGPQKPDVQTVELAKALNEEVVLVVRSTIYR